MGSKADNLLFLESSIATKAKQYDSSFSPYGTNASERPDRFLFEVGKCWLTEQVWLELPKFANFLSEADQQWRDKISSLDEVEDDRLRGQRIKDTVIAMMISMGYPGDFPGGLALYSDVFLGRILRNVIHPYLGAACIRWAGAHADFSPGGVIKELSKMTDEWEGQPTRRPLIESRIRAFALDGYRVACR